MNRRELKLNRKECAKAIRLVRKRLANKKVPFTLDTCIIVYLSRFGHTKLLEEVYNAEHYLLLQSNINEISIFQRKNVFPDFIAILVNFMQKSLDNGRFTEVDTEKFEQELSKLIPLIPRRLIHDVMINLEDSYLNNLIKLYESENRAIEEVKKEPITNKEFYERERKIKLLTKKGIKILEESIDKRFNERYIELCDNLKVNDAVIHTKGFEKKYFEDIQKFKYLIFNEIDKIRRLNNLSALILGLKELSKKTYDEDVGFVAETIAHGAEGESSDSDVVNLFVIHACKLVA